MLGLWNLVQGKHMLEPLSQGQATHPSSRVQTKAVLASHKHENNAFGLGILSNFFGLDEILVGLKQDQALWARNLNTEALIYILLFLPKVLLFIFCYTSLKILIPTFKEISPEYSLEGQMLKLKLQYFGHLRWRMDSLENTLMLGKIEGRRRREQQGMRWLMASPTRWTWVWASSGSWWCTWRPGVLQFMWLERVGHDWAT